MADQTSFDRFIKRARELSKVQPRGEGGYWIDHQTLTAGDIDRLADARRLTLWNVRLPPGFYDALPKLEFLDLRGGTAISLDPIAGATQLRGLVVNQVRGLTDLEAITRLVRLEILSLYGLAHIERLPSLAPLNRLRRVEIGQMRSLTDISGLAEAPGLEELLFVRKLGIDAQAVRPFNGHPSLTAFDWYAEDVARSQVEPVLKALPLSEKPALMSPDEWLAKKGRP